MSICSDSSEAEITPFAASAPRPPVRVARSQASQDAGREGCPLTWAPSADAVAGGASEVSWGENLSLLSPRHCAWAQEREAIATQRVHALTTPLLPGDRKRRKRTEGKAGLVGHFVRCQGEREIVARRR